MWRKGLWMLGMTLGLFWVGTGAQAAQRVALVMGNGAYQHTQRLTNPVNDASDMGAALRKLGFDVHSGNDLDANGMRSRLQKFASAANGAELALVFYAGHGIQADGANYLIPVDAKLDTPLSLRFQGIAMSDVMAAASGARTKVLLVDACRDNPLASQWASEGRNVSRGLGRIETTDGGTLIAFATRPGAIAADGTGRNSPFTSALLQHLETPGIELRILLTRVRNRVLELTRNAQEPWTEESLRSEIYLLPGSGSPSSAATAPSFDPRSVELAYWQSAVSAGSVEAFQDYKRQYPQGQFVAQANIQLAALTRPRPNPTQAPTAGASAPAPVTQSQYGAGGVLLRPASLSGLSAGTVFRDCEDCPEMVRVPTGRFEMGSPSYEADRKADEGPVHEVRIDYSLAVGKFEVTRGQWRQFMSESGHVLSVNGCNILNPTDGKWVVQLDKSWRDTGFAQDDQHPVVCVVWKDVKAYTVWLSRKTGKQYRLLSEAEFEYVNRAGTSTPWFWGSDPQQACRYANNADTRYAQWRGWSGVTGGAKCDDGYANTAPVGRYQANAFGLYDTTGNVLEWTEDCWNEGYVGAPTNGAVWAAGDCARRVVRGGSWFYPPATLRAAFRLRNTATAAYIYLGFRLARTD